MGVHISFVRSTTLDSWKRGELRVMEVGGNGRAKAFFRQHGVPDSTKSDEKKYKSRAAELYRAQLKREVYEAKVTSNIDSSETFSESVVQTEAQRKAAENKAKIDSAIAAAKDKANAKPAKPLKLDTKDGEKILSRKQVQSKNKSLGATKVASNAFDDFDESSSEEEEINNEASTNVTRHDLAALALDDKVKKPDTKEQEEQDAYRPKGRPIISSRLQYVDPDEERKAQAKEPRSRDLQLNMRSRGYDDKPGVTTSNGSGSGPRGGGKSMSSDDRDRFSSATSISSAQFFGDDTVSSSDRSQRAAAFEGATAISSSQYFGDDDEVGGGAAYNDSMGDLAETGKKIANMASSFFSDFAERYNS